MSEWRRVSPQFLGERVINVNDFYQTEGKWLKAADLKDKKHRVTIDKVEIVEFKDNTKKAAITFKGREKGMVLNKTNAAIIAKEFGPDTDAWAGKGIVIYPTTTDFGGEQVDCIRVERHIAEAEADIGDAPF